MTVARSALTRPHALLMTGVLLFFYLDDFVLGARVLVLDRR